jgi:glutaredoxin
MKLLIGKADCYFCDKSEVILQKSNVPFVKINIDDETYSQQVIDFLIKLVKVDLKQHTVPVIFDLKEGGFNSLVKEYPSGSKA